MNELLKLNSALPRNRLFKLACVLIAASLMSGCEDESVLAGGGGAGDTNANTSVQASIDLLQPYVGVYQLQDGWMGNLGDQAYLSIRLTGNDGVSEVALIDYDDVNSCVPNRISTGEVRKDLFSDRVFMDDILQFNQAELSLNGDNLSIESTDAFDIDNDTNTTEIVNISATRLGVTEVDLGDPC